MKFENVDAIGQGRVWTGTDALKIGLVDKLGNLDAAIKYAATLGKSKEYRVETYPEYEKNFNEILEHLANAKIYQSKEAYLKEEVGEENYILIDKIRKMKKRKGIQAILPYEINF